MHRKTVVIPQVNFLKTTILRNNVEVFLCGPGIGAKNHEIRQATRDYLHSIERVKVSYGEDIESIGGFRSQGADLQTLEHAFAHHADLTIMILDSPGSFAELGTFSMVPNVRSRLVVLVPDQFFGATSYIARGPLSLVARAHPNNVIYFDQRKMSDISDQIQRHVAFYKYAASWPGYSDHIRSAYKRKTYGEYDYLKFISPIYERYRSIVALISIICLPNPTFPEIMLSTGMTPKELVASLKMLFDENRILKIPGGRYHSTNGFEDSLLGPFNTSELSIFGAKLLGSN